MKPRKNDAIFIVMEGLDGSGKSTTARLVADEIGAELLTTPSAPLRELRGRIISELGDSQEARQAFYIATVLAASKKIEELLSRGQSVVLDRYFLSTQAYAAFRDSKLGLDSVGDLLVPADLTVFLHAPLDVRIERIEERGASAADRETMQPEADARLWEEHLRRSNAPYIGKWLSLDTSETRPPGLVQCIVSTADGRESIHESTYRHTESSV